MIRALFFLLLVGCDTARHTQACMQACTALCRTADEAYQNDPDKNAACAECLRECERSR